MSYLMSVGAQYWPSVGIQHWPSVEVQYWSSVGIPYWLEKLTLQYSLLGFIVGNGIERRR